jgi:hypothetical protein
LNGLGDDVPEVGNGAGRGSPKLGPLLGEGELNRFDTGRVGPREEKKRICAFAGKACTVVTSNL